MSALNPESRILAPIVILVRPQLGENIGAAARAMSNFGLKELRLVAPRAGWMSEKAVGMASGGESILKGAKEYADLPSAMKDIHIAYATTARSRDMEKPVVSPETASKDMQKQAASGVSVALLFGPERTGLENEDLAACDTLISIPTAPENTSLNIAQSVVIMGYEWWKSNASKNLIAPALSPPATKHDWQGLFNQLEAYLDDANFFRVAHKKTVMWENLRTMLLRGRFSAQEIRTFRGMLRVLWEGRQPRKKSITK